MSVSGVWLTPVQLENFQLEGEYGTVVLQSLGHHWDLHNFADFIQLRYAPGERLVVLAWSVPEHATNPWGDPSNSALGCQIHFEGVSYFAVSPRDPKTPVSEDATLECVSKVQPVQSERRYRRAWHPGEPFRLRFEFHGGTAIEVESENARLVAVPREDDA